jgi:2-polyprenyl-3-methyl-5-hydroxy-6-metoxy-1,4-benzoquinol methylase
MRYKVKGQEIRSENTAKSVLQASQYLKRWISNHEIVDDALDFGCGKLRYSITLASCARKLTLVDSEVQLSRNQIIEGKRTSVYDYVNSHFSHVRVLNFEAFLLDHQKYDLVICANVLSAIPIVKIRSRVLKSILHRLKLTGKCLFVNQFRDSYFKKISKSPFSKSYLDGWLRITPNGNFYYGIFPKEKLENLLSKHGFSIYKSWEIKDIAHVIAQRKQNQLKPNFDKSLSEKEIKNKW